MSTSKKAKKVQTVLKGHYWPFKGTNGNPATLGTYVPFICVVSESEKEWEGEKVKEGRRKRKKKKSKKRLGRKKEKER